MGWTWDQARTFLNGIAEASGEWAGAPIPVETLRLRLEPRYPYQLDGMMLDEKDGLTTGKKPDSGEPLPTLVNEWLDHPRMRRVIVYRMNGSGSRAFVMPQCGSAKLVFWINTLAASTAWGAHTEGKALEKLRGLVTEHAFNCYTLSGAFLETSKRSKVTYLFRKLRPTIALRPTNGGANMKVLACLCLHPIGYYERSWAGVMCPTDDVIAHLVMMRGDEAKFWGKANHHNVFAAEAGL